MLVRLARTTYQHRRITVTLWIVVLILGGFIAPSFAGKWTENDRLKGADSQAAYDLLQSHMPSQNDANATVVFQGVVDHQTAIANFLGQAKTVSGVEDVGALTTSKDGRVAIATIGLTTDEDKQTAAVAALNKSATTLTKAGVQTSFEGDPFSNTSPPASEVLGIVAALIVLLIAFGSVMAAGLPILVALFGVGISLGLVGLLAHVVDMGNATSEVTPMMSIGVGIDYTLLIVSRYRNALSRLKDCELAVVDAMCHAGHAALVAGSIVIVSLAGLFVMGMSTFSGIAVGAAVGVLLAILASLTFTPALLGFIGNNINRLHIGKKGKSAKNESRRWVELVQRRARIFAFAGIGMLLILASPMLSLNLANPDEGSAPKGSTNLDAYQAISKSFGPGYNGPILLVVENPNSNLTALVDTLARTPGIASVDVPIFSTDRSIAVVNAIPTTGPITPATKTLINHIRKDISPMFGAQGMALHVGGETASNIDFAHICAQRLPLFAAVVLSLSFILLLVTFRSVVIPFKAVMLNLLSLGATGGIIVALFQWGWAASVLGFTAGPVAPWIPELLFAILFGLSMDYEIFLLTSVREARLSGVPARKAVFDGLGSTARIITAAAAIMTVVFASFVTAEDLSIKMIGFGAAVGVAIDATVVRMIIVPAVMSLLDEKAWWWPSRHANALEISLGSRVKVGATIE